MLDEARLVNERINRYHATHATLTQLAVASGNGIKEATKALSKMLREMTED